MTASDLANGIAKAPRGLAKSGAHVEVSAQALARALEELIAALDRRVPRVKQAGEAAIARDAAALRAKAVERLATIVSARTGSDAKGNGGPP